jgi:hypothetical protein
MVRVDEMLVEVYLYLRKSPPLFIVTGNGTEEIDLRSFCEPRMGRLEVERDDE